MRIKLKSELSFIMKSGILEGTVEPLGGGSYVFRNLDGRFKQILKKNEYEAMAAAGATKVSVEPTTSKKTESPAQDKTEEEQDSKLHSREDLEMMSIKDLRAIAETLYDNFPKNTKHSEIVNLILEAELEESEE